MSEPTKRVRRLVHQSFPREVRDTVLELLTGIDTERVQAAVLLAAGDDERELLVQVDLAHLDWRDVLVNGGLAHEGWPAVLDRELGRA